MEPLTHALTSVALARVGLNKATRLAMPILVTSGVAADLDLLSRSSGPLAYLKYHRAVTHSLVGSALLVAIVAGAFWWLGKRLGGQPIRLARALLLAGIGASVHLLLDLANSDPVRLLWPFRESGFAGDLAEWVDPWILVVLLLGLLLPVLFRLVSEEIGARPPGRGPRRGAIAALVLLVAYGGARFLLHDRAVELLRSRLYHDMTPLAVGAFPSSASPLAWHGVVETENTLDELEVTLGPGSYFDPERGRTHFKPEASPMLEAARKTQAVQDFLKYARFPSASVQRESDGYRVVLQDLRFPPGSRRRDRVVASVELDSETRVLSEGLRFQIAAKF